MWWCLCDSCSGTGEYEAGKEKIPVCPLEKTRPHGWRRLLVSGDQEHDGHSSWAPWSYVEIGEIYRRTNITATLHPIQSLWQCGQTQCLSSVKKHEKTLGICKKKAPKGPPDCEKQDYLVWWTLYPKIMFEGNQALLITCRLPSQK